MFYSFDAFDTLITRRTATPAGIFALIQEKLISDTSFSDIPMHIRSNFFQIRRGAEALARKNARERFSRPDVTLKEIYSAVALSGELNESMQHRLIKLEIDIEYENSEGITKNIDKLKKLMADGNRVVIISYMYLDAKTVRRMLLKADSVFENIPIYMSDDLMAVKSDGSIYEAVKRAEDIDFGEWVHFGDNRQQDVQAARNKGIDGRLIKFEELLPYELEAVHMYEDRVSVQLTIGAARNARLLGRLKGAAAVGAAFGGPMLYPYVKWILDESLAKHIRKLYFIARDGFVLKAIADVMIEKMGLPIETHYIYGSRRAWRMPSLPSGFTGIRDIMKESYLTKVQTVEELADVFEISEDEMRMFMIKGECLSSLLMRIEKGNGLEGYLKEKNIPKRQLVAAYLKQEIDISDDDFAFVEFAGSGFTQGCLADIMSDFYDGRIRSFYYKNDKVNFCENCTYYTFYPSSMSMSIILEMLVRSKEAQTDGYHYDNGHVVPAFSSDGEGMAIDAHGFDDYFKGVLAYVSEYMRSGRNDTSLDMIRFYMKYFEDKPDRQLLDFIADMPGKVTGREKTLNVFAPVLTGDVIREYYLNNNIEAYKGTYMAVSLMRCKVSDKALIKKYQHEREKLIQENPVETVRKFDISEIDGKVAIYAAGRYGQALYDQLKKKRNTEVVKWVDRKLAGTIVDGMYIDAVGSLEDMEFDRVLLAVKDRNAASEIWDELQKMGIPQEKIIWMQPVKHLGE